jgi:anaerobic magnesium-protoporphyrin IX monomethyl ester cyclase
MSGQTQSKVPIQPGFGRRDLGMRVAFVMEERQVAEPLGLMYLSSLCRSRGHEARLFFSSDRDFIERLRSYHPQVLAYSVISGSHKPYLRINRAIKDLVPAFSVFGGPHTTFFPETIHAAGVDAICVGEGEYAFLELVQRLEDRLDISDIPNLWVKSGGTIFRNPVRDLISDLDGLPFPDRELIYGSDRYLQESKIKRFMSNRGCPFQCTYCFNRSYKEIYKGQKIIRWRSVESLIEEIAQCKAEYPLELVRFVDDIFILPPVQWLEEFAASYKRNIRLPFVCNLQVKLVQEHKIRLLKEAGCVAVYMAIEVGNDRMRNVLLERRMTKEEIVRAFDLVHKHGISIAAENILGLPGGSLETDLETLELNIRCRVDNPVSTLFQPYPKTRLGQYALEKGYYNGDLDFIEKSYFGKSRVAFHSEREKRQVENLHRFFGFAVTHPSALPLVKGLIRLPPNRFFDLFHRLWDSFCKKKRIFNVKMGLRDYVLAIQRILHY